ncbi:MAG: TetR/AcrR family transcriptional regulator [Candidatus Acidiferrales bacterium]
MTAVKQPIRRRTEKARRREQILAAAFEEFAINGYAATRLDDVARRAKIAKGTIFLHFDNKRVLFRAVLRGFIQPVFSGFQAFLQGFSGTAEVLLRDLLSRQYVEVVRNKRARALLRLLIAESGKFPELAQMYRREIIDPGTSALGLVIDRGVASGEFQATGIHNFPQILVAPTVLAVVWILVLGERHGLDFDAYREAHLDLVLRGLRSVDSTNAPKDTEFLRAGEAS